MNVIGTQMRDLINSGLPLCGLTVLMNTVAEIGREERNPRASTRFNLGVENEKADAGRDIPTCLARPNFQARTGTVKISFSCSAGHK